MPVRGRAWGSPVATASESGGIHMQRIVAIAAAAAMMVLFTACGTGESAPDVEARSGTASYLVDNSGLGNDFTGNYLWVQGQRSVAADGKYPCLNQFEACLPLDAAGRSIPIQDLCPSNNTPTGTWSFNYALYADADCAVPLQNLYCEVDKGETLQPGPNSNSIACLTYNASKDFDVCVYDPVTGAGLGNCLFQFSGILNDVPVADLTGWTQCYMDTYALVGTPLADIFAGCPGSKLLLGCRPTGATYLQAAAMGERADVLFDTGIGDNGVTHVANGVGWYYSPDWSWGFAPVGEPVSKMQCDWEDVTDPQRLCWHTGIAGLFEPATLNYGWRCGADIWLNDPVAGGAFERLIFTAD